jgi:hypothetical protein
MAKVTVEIDLPNVTVEDLHEREFFDGDNIIIDEAYLERFEEDDSFFMFKFISAEDTNE